MTEPVTPYGVVQNLDIPWPKYEAPRCPSCESELREFQARDMRAFRVCPQGDWSGNSYDFLDDWLRRKNYQHRVPLNASTARYIERLISQHSKILSLIQRARQSVYARLEAESVFAGSSEDPSSG